jgi:hypothetical protein
MRPCLDVGDRDSELVAEPVFGGGEAAAGLASDVLAMGSLTPKRILVSSSG